MADRKLPKPVSKYQSLFAKMNQTQSCAQIGRKYGISKQRVSFLIKNGAETAQKIQKIDGISLKEYCRRNGLRYWAVRKYVYEDGLSPEAAVSQYISDIKEKVQRESKVFALKY